MAEWLWQALLAIGFGIGSAVIPFLNAEAYVLGAGVSGALNPVTAGIGVAIGQTIGKLAMFLAVRYRPGYAAGRTHREPRALDLSTRLGRLRQWYRDTSKRMLDGLGDPRYGIPVTLLSAFVGIPPLYAVCLIAGASRMRVLTFTATVLTGRVGRFVLIGLGISMF
jgi:membrane protein YqaA with SNARE-associated domain